MLGCGKVVSPPSWLRILRLTPAPPWNHSSKRVDSGSKRVMRMVTGSYCFSGKHRILPIFEFQFFDWSKNPGFFGHQIVSVSVNKSTFCRAYLWFSEYPHRYVIFLYECLVLLGNACLFIINMHQFWDTLKNEKYAYKWGFVTPTPPHQEKTKNSKNRNHHGVLIFFSFLDRPYSVRFFTCKSSLRWGKTLGTIWVL